MKVKMPWRAAMNEATCVIERLNDSQRLQVMAALSCSKARHVQIVVK
jgi:hypothetical protein